MNSKTAVLKTLIEQIVIKELRKQLPILLQELLSDGGENETETHTPTGSKSFKSLQSLISETTSTPRVNNIPKAPKKYSKDPMVNSILNETVNDLHLRESGRLPAVGLDGKFSTTASPDVGMLTENIEQINKSINCENLPEEVGASGIKSILDYVGKDEAVDNLMKWDFKAILDKSKKR